MSHEEQAAIVGKVVLEHVAVGKELALLQSKAKAIGDALQTVASALQGRVEWAIEDGRFLTRAPAGSTSHPVPPAWDDVAALLQQIVDARKRLTDLTAERQRLGV